jgi:hypothetical protein
VGCDEVGIQLNAPTLPHVDCEETDEACLAPTEAGWREGGSETRPYRYGCQFGTQSEYPTGQKGRSVPRPYNPLNVEAKR